MVSVNPWLSAFASVPQDKIRSGLPNRQAAGSLVQLRLCSEQMPPEWKPGPHPPLCISVSKKIIKTDGWLTRSLPANYGHLAKSLSINQYRFPFIGRACIPAKPKWHHNDVDSRDTPFLKHSLLSTRGKCRNSIRYCLKILTGDSLLLSLFTRIHPNKNHS